MKLLLLGSGGREHALAWKIAQSPKIEKLYIAPGNAGTSEVGENVAIKADDFAAIKEFVVKNDINMVVVGPEDPLVKGIYDYFKNDEALKNVPVIGPSKAGAVLEGSKEFAKGFMQRHHIPTAGYKSITAANLEEGLAFLETLEAPYVLKADGLCAGKGVLILPTLEEAKKELKEMLSGMFGDASATVVIEEFLSGIECSVFVLTDGKNYKILPEAKDYKRIGEGDSQHDGQHHVSHDRDDGGDFAVGKRGEHAGSRDAKAVEEEGQRIDMQAVQDDLEQLGLFGLGDKNADERPCRQLADDHRGAVGNHQEYHAIAHKPAHHLVVLVAVVIAVDGRDAV